ncbi:hypothetical protein JCM15124A_04420 [Prevotella falsenii]
MAGKTLVFAAVVMMGIGFTACSSDNNDDPQKEQKDPKEDEPKQETFTNTVNFDGKEVKIAVAELANVKDNIYWLTLGVEDGSDVAQIVVSFIPDIHNMGNEIDLSQQNDEGNMSNSWSIMGLNKEQIIFCGQEATDIAYKFKSGKMKLKLDMATRETELTITDAVIETSHEKGFGDGNEHRFSISYKGTAKEQAVQM